MNPDLFFLGFKRLAKVLYYHQQEIFQKNWTRQQLAGTKIREMMHVV
jgi:hypothetical protein